MSGDPVADKLEMTANIVRALLQSLGQDPDREGLQETPARVAKFLQGFCHPDGFAFTTFDAESDEMIVQAGIPFASLCEHHMLPFVGTAAVAYIPGKRMAGLSKLARAVQHCAAGLQNQERVTKATGDLLEKALEPVGVGVILRARHLCMEMRGVKAAGTWTVTSNLRGAFLEPAPRAEFLHLAKECW